LGRTSFFRGGRIAVEAEEFYRQMAVELGNDPGEIRVWIEGAYAPSTARARVSNLICAYRHFFKREGISPGEWVKGGKAHMMLRRCMKGLEEEGLKPYKIVDVKCTLSALLSYCMGPQELGKNPQVKVAVRKLRARIPPPRIQPKYPPPLKLLKWCEENGVEELDCYKCMGKCAVLTILALMCRIAEMFSINPGSVRFEEGDLNRVYFTWRGKSTHGRMERKFMEENRRFPTRCPVRTMKAYLNMREALEKEQQWVSWRSVLWVNPEGTPITRPEGLSIAMKKVMREAGLPERITPYTLKSMAVTWHMDRKVPTARIADVTNHSEKGETLSKFYYKRQGPWLPAELLDADLPSGEEEDAGSSVGEGNGGAATEENHDKVESQAPSPVEPGSLNIQDGAAVRSGRGCMQLTPGIRRLVCNKPSHGELQPHPGPAQNPEGVLPTLGSPQDKEEGETSAGTGKRKRRRNRSEEVGRGFSGPPMRGPSSPHEPHTDRRKRTRIGE
jgi:site-specific recombinase XerD